MKHMLLELNGSMDANIAASVTTKKKRYARLDYYDNFYNYHSISMVYKDLELCLSCITILQYLN